MRKAAALGALAGTVAAALALAAAATDGPAAPALCIVCFGDSITGHRPGEPYLHAYVKYSDLLGLMLEARLGAGGAEVLNHGYDGDRTFKAGDRPGALNRVEREVVGLRPDVAIVLIGGNDAPKTDEERERTRGNLAAIWSRLREAGVAKVLALGYHVLPNPESPETAWEHLDDVNPLIAETAAACGVAYLDMGPAMRAAAKKHPLGELVDGRDGVHLRPRGEMVYARAIFARLDELGWLEAEPEADKAK